MGKVDANATSIRQRGLPALRFTGAILLLLAGAAVITVSQHDKLVSKMSYATMDLTNSLKWEKGSIFSFFPWARAA